MSIRDVFTKAFAKSKELPQRRRDDAANIEAAARDKEQRETATALDAAQAKVMRTHLTPESTIEGTQPKPALNEKQGRDLAEKIVAAEAGKEDKAGPVIEPEKKQADESRQAAEQKTDPLEAGAATPADIAEVEKWTVVHDLEADKAAATEWTPEAEAQLIAAEREARLARDAQSLGHETDIGRDAPR